MPVIEVPMKKDENDHHTMDIEALEKAIKPEVKSLILCNPHNPVGRVYHREELEELLAFCVKHNLLIIADEIHCELDLEGRHIPFFSLNEQAAQCSVTVSSAGKICNIPGLPMGFAIIPNKELRAKFISQQDGLLPCPNVLTLAAYEKAYDGSCDGWKAELRDYLRANRDYAHARLSAIAGLRLPHNEGTYLFWVDCSALGLANPAEFFEQEAHVKVCDGDIYGNRQCVRLNYGCPRSQLKEALDRMERAITALRGKK
jgi:cystathionine beta-lyase